MFSRWLEKQLQRREWTQADLVRHGSFSRSAVSAWVNGERIPDTASCERLADALRVAPDDVLAVAGHRPKGEDEDDPIAAALITLIRKTRWTEDRAVPVRAMLEAMATLFEKSQRTR